MRLLCVLLVLLISYAPTRAAEPPILNLFLEARPTPVAAGGELTIQADIYSTSDLVEWAHVEITTDPAFRLAATGVLYNGALGQARCARTLYRLSCEVPIRIWSPVSAVAVLDVPSDGAYLWPCNAALIAHAMATLPGRQRAADQTVPVMGVERSCTYLPLVAYGG